MPGYIDLEEDGADPSNPTGNDRRLFAKGNAAFLRLTGGTNVPLGVQSDYVRLRHRQSTGTAGGTATAGAWYTCPLNEETQDTAGICTLSSNEFSLPAGTYQVAALQNFCITGNTMIRLYNVTDSTEVARGSFLIVYTGGYSGGPSILQARFTLAGTKTLRLEYKVGTTRATDGLGSAWASEDITHAQVELVRLS